MCYTVHVYEAYYLTVALQAYPTMLLASQIGLNSTAYIRNWGTILKARNASKWISSS